VLQESSIYTPAAGVLAAAGAVPLQHYSSPAKQGQPIYELRQYQVRRCKIWSGRVDCHLPSWHCRAHSTLCACLRGGPGVEQ